MDGQIKSQKNLEKRFEALNRATEIQRILTSSKNCRETFKNINFTDYLFNQEPLPLTDFKKYRKIKIGNSTKEEFLSTNTIKSPYPSKSFHLRRPFIKLRDYEKVKEGETIREVDIYLILPFSWTEQSTARKIPLSLRLNDQGKIESCSTGNSSGAEQLVVLDPTKNPPLNGLTGKKACKDQGLTCLKVYSQNYATTVYGQIGLDNLCATNYNKSLPGVEDGANLSQWHSCDAKLGIYETYSIDKKSLQLTCKGIFSSFCQ